MSPDKYTPAGIVHRGEGIFPDGNGGLIHRYSDGEVIWHYATVAEFIAVLEDNDNGH